MGRVAREQKPGVGLAGDGGVRREGHRARARQPRHAGNVPGGQGLLGILQTDIRRAF